MPAAEPRVLGECGGKSFVEDDMIRFMQQRMGRRARISAVASRLLTEEGDLTGRRLPRIDWLEPVGYRQKAREETAQLLKSSRKSRAEAADHDVWDPEAQWAHFPNCVVHDEDGLMYRPTEQEREQALALVLADARRGEPAPAAVGDVGDAAVCVMAVEVALARCVQRYKTRHMRASDLFAAVAAEIGGVLSGSVLELVLTATTAEDLPPQLRFSRSAGGAAPDDSDSRGDVLREQVRLDESIEIGEAQHLGALSALARGFLEHLLRPDSAHRGTLVAHGRAVIVVQASGCRRLQEGVSRLRQRSRRQCQREKLFSFLHRYGALITALVLGPSRVALLGGGRKDLPQLAHPSRNLWRVSNVGRLRLWLRHTNLPCHLSQRLVAVLLSHGSLEPRVLAHGGTVPPTTLLAHDARLRGALGRHPMPWEAQHRNHHRLVRHRLDRLGEAPAPDVPGWDVEAVVDMAAALASVVRVDEQALPALHDA